MKKKFVYYVLAIILVLALCACGKQAQPAPTAEPVATAEPTVAPTATPEIVYVTAQPEETPEIIYVNTPVPAPDPTEAPANPYAGADVIYIWADGTQHDTPEEGQEAVSSIRKYIFYSEPDPAGPVQTFSGSVVCTLEDGKYVVLNNGYGTDFVFYVEGKPVDKLDGMTGLEPDALCTIYYNGGTLKPDYGIGDVQYVFTQKIQTDSRADYNAVVNPKPTAKPGPNPTPYKPTGYWYGTDGMLHCYINGIVYHWANNGWVQG